MENKLTNVLLCSSITQVVNFKCVLEKRNILHNSDNYVIVIHVALDINIKKIIYDYCEIFKFKKLIDLSKHIDEIHYLLSRLHFARSLKNFYFYRNIKKDYNSLTKIEDQIKNILASKVGRVNNVVLRNRFSRIDSIICRLIENKKNIFFVDDGLVDYMDIYWPLKTFSFHEIKHYLNTQISKIVNTVINSFCCKNFFKIYKMYFYQIGLNGLHYYNLKKDQKISLRSQMKNTIEFLYARSRELDFPKNNKRIVIIGGLIGDHNFNKYSIDKQIKIDIYKNVIEKIKNKHNVSANTIWYIKHPRLPYEYWLNLKKNLDCNFYKFNDFRIAEIILCNPDILAVYSISSSALLHASEILKIDSYLINILSIAKYIHPSSYKKAAAALKLYGVKKELIVDKRALKNITEYLINV